MRGDLSTSRRFCRPLPMGWGADAMTNDLAPIRLSARLREVYFGPPLTLRMIPGGKDTSPVAPCWGPDLLSDPQDGAAPLVLPSGVRPKAPFHPALTHEANWAAVGIIRQDHTPYIVTSTGGMANAVDAHAANWIYQKPLVFPDMADRWTEESVARFCASLTAPTFGAMVRDTRDTLEWFLEIDRYDATVVACWL